MLELAAYAVRSAFRLALPRFPELCCVEAALILQRALRQLGHPARIVSGEFRLDKALPNSAEEPEAGLTVTFAHHWVEVDETVIDITGDQFDPGLRRPWPPMYIGTRGDRYINVDSGEAEPSELIDTPTCQAVLFELRWLPPDVALADPPEGGLGVADFTWWDSREPYSGKRFAARRDALGTTVESLVTDMAFRGSGRILPDETLAWMTWAPPKFGDNVAYRKRPHITLDVTPQELVLHLNLELANNADHFAGLVLRDPGRVLDQAIQLGCALELQIYQRRHIRGMKWELERPVFYPLDEMTPERLHEVVGIAQAWGNQEGTRQAYFISQRIPAARAIALGQGLPAELSRRIERLRPGLDDFDWKR